MCKEVPRVIHVIGKMDRAGAETMIMNLYRKIDRNLVQFDFLSFSAVDGDYDEEIKYLYGRVFHLPVQIYKNPISRSLAFYRILKKHSEIKVVHSHVLFANAFFVLAAFFAGIKIRISHSHNTSDGIKKNFITILYQFISKIFIHLFSTNFVSCGAAAKSLFPYTKKVLILNNGIDLSEFVKERSQQYNKNKKVKILQVGRFLPVKNHLFSINIAKYLEDRNFNFELSFIGDGEQKKILENKVKEIGLTNVNFLGKRTDIAELMNSSDINILPSLFEGFPVVLVEAQAAGIPSVVSSKVSCEVSLGLSNLINFCEIENTTSVKDWANLIINLSSQVPQNFPNSNERLEKLKINGFDASHNVNLLLKLYKI